MTETTTAAPETSNEGNVSTPETNADVSVATETGTQQPAVESEATSVATPDDATSPESAPESYETFTVPEGSGSLDEGVLAKFGETAKELNLSQDNAQKMIDSLVPTMQEKQAAKMEAQVQAWADETASDKELGGDRLTETMSTARKAYQMGASEKLQGLLKQTGLDVHPEMVRMFHYFGDRISEDKVVNGGTPSAPASIEGDVFSNTALHAKKLYG